MRGKVWLVGAGPADPGLFTLKGRKILQEADVVVYDALVGRAILDMIPDSAEIIYAGKRAGNHTLRQEETNQILLQEALKGKKVVRLKGGDPFVFGRGGEELELLAEHQIPFEVVPGVTSAFAVPAYNGIPVTHRDFCSSVHVITGHRRKDLSYDIDFEALVRTKGTLVFLMGISSLADICRGLMDAGMEETMPAAVLERGTTAAQRRVIATVATLPSECEKNQIQTPAIIVVGKVCELAETFSWFEKRPLAGVRVMVTRPREQMHDLSERLRQEGAEVLEMPAIRTVPVYEDDADKERAELLDEALDCLENGGYDWLIFTSPAGVRIFFKRLYERKDMRILSGIKIAVIGEGSRKALRSYGLRADFMPDTYDGENLGRQLAGILPEGSRILIPRAAAGNQELIEELKKVPEVQITDAASYDTKYVSSRLPEEEQALENADADYVLFTSASCVRGFAAGSGRNDFSGVRAICIGRQTQTAAEELGMQTRTSLKATMDSMIDCLKDAVREGIK